MLFNAQTCKDLHKRRRSHTIAYMEERNNIVIYQSEDGLVSMEAMVLSTKPFGLRRRQ